MVKIRSGVLEDNPFIMSSWLQSHYAGSDDFARRIPDTIYYRLYHKIVSILLARETTRVLVATPPDDPDVIIGYLVYERTSRGDFLHYVYVKRPFGKMGVCRALVESVPFEFDRKVKATHRTLSGRSLIRKLGIGYNPNAI